MCGWVMEVGVEVRYRGWVMEGCVKVMYIAHVWLTLIINQRAIQQSATLASYEHLGV